MYKVNSENAKLNVHTHTHAKAATPTHTHKTHNHQESQELHYTDSTFSFLKGNYLLATVILAFEH